MKEDLTANTQRDPYEQPWHLLGVVDERKDPHWTQELGWIFDRKFPPQHEVIMSRLFDRAMAIIGGDRTLLNSLLFDNRMLKDLLERTAKTQKGSSRNYSHLFWSLQFHEMFDSQDVCWSRQLAMESIVLLSDAMFFDVYGLPLDEFEYDEHSHTLVEIDSGLCEFINYVVEAGELIALAELVANNNHSPTLLQRENKSEALDSSGEQQRRAARIRHQPVADLKQECYEFYKSGNFKSYADAARRFYNQLHPEKSKLLKPDNAEKLLAEAIGKLVRLDRD